jgi:4-hydroxy-tetrahydrodipicolinate synthase
MGRTTDVVRLPLVTPAAATRLKLERLAGELGLLKFAPVPEGGMRMY